MIGSNSWRALMWRNAIYRRRNIIGTILELALPVGFIALLVLIKSSVQDTEGFAPQVIEAEFPDTTDAMLMFSYNDYVTAMQAKRVCKSSESGFSSGGRGDFDYEISGMPSGGFNWQVPFVKCDRRLCTENGEDAFPYCEYLALGVAPSSASDTVGKERAEAFRDYIRGRFPVLANTTSLPFDFDFVRVFESNQDLENYVQAEDYKMPSSEKPKLGMAVVWDGTDGVTDSYSYTIRVNGTYFNNPESQTQPGAATTPPTDQNFEHFAKDDNDCPVAAGSPNSGGNSGCTGRYMTNGVLPTQRLIHDFIFENSNAKNAGYFVAEQGVRFAPFPSREYVSEGFYAAIAAWVPLLVILGILYPVASMTRYIVLEKQNRQKELMKMMGIPESDIASSWYMSFLLFHIFTAVGCGVVTKLFYAKSSIELLIIFWILSFTSLISMCSFLASFFTKATRATLVSLMFTFGGYFITLFVDFRIDASASVMASSLHPAAAFGFGLQEIGRLEDLDVGLIWNTLDETDSPSGFTFLNTLTMLLVDTVLYAVLAWYTNRVVPGEFGRPLPLHFPFTMAYWFPGRIAPSTSSDEVPVDSAVHSEPVSRNLKDQAKEGKSIEIRNLSKHFQEKIAVDGLNLSMYRGQCTALLGHNGAGKTTTLNMLTGMMAPTDGYAVVAGKDIRTQMTQIRQEIGICLQHDCLFDILTVKEHIQFFAMVKGLYSKSDRKEAEEKIKSSIQDVALWEKRSTYSKNLSGGMKRKLSVAIAFCGDSKTVFLDEPTSGMDPFSRRFTWNVIRQYREDRCIILTTHFMDEADILGDRIAIMADGQLRCIGSSLFLKKSYGVGYNLTIEMKNGGNTADIQSTVKEIITSDVSNATMLTNVGAEMNFQLPIGSSSSFSSMLTRLDDEIENGTVANYGLGITTLEEVFLLVARGESNEKTDLTASQRNLPEGEDPEDLHSIKLEENLFGRHVGALFRKRAANFKRDKKAWMCSTILPSLFVLSGFLIVKYSSSVKEFEPLDLTLDTFNSKVSESPRNPITINNASIFQCQPGKCAYDSDFIEEEITNETYSFCGYHTNIGNNSTCSGGETTDDILTTLKDHGSRAVYASGQSVLQSSESISETAEKFAASQYGGIYFTSNDDSSVQINQNSAAGPDLGALLAMFGGDLDSLLSQFGDGNSTNLEDLLSQLRADNGTLVDDLLAQFGGSIGGSSNGTDFGDLLSQNLTYGELVEASCLRQQDDYSNPEYCSLYRGLGYLIRYNFTAVHGAPIFQATADEAIIRHALNNSDFKINPSLYPLPLTNFELGIQQNDDAGVPWFLIVFGFPFITGSFATFVVAERESKSKHLQTVAGVKPLAYWLSTWLWDIANYLIPMTITIILLFAFDTEAFTTKEHDVVYGVIALLVLFGPAAASFTYCITFIFKSPSVCNLVVIISNFLIGYAGAIACFVLRLIGDNPFAKDEGLLNAAIITEWVLRIFPSFSLSKGLFYILFIDQFQQLKGEEFNVWHKDMILYEVIFLAWQSIGYLLLAVMIDSLSSNPFVVSIWRKIFCCQWMCSSHAGQSSNTESEEDDDVIAEQNRVLEGNTENNVIVLKELTKKFDNGLTAVDNLSFAIPPGQCFGLLGINGAGKTTTMAMLTAEFPPSGGDAMLAGYSVLRQPEKTRRRVGYCPQFDAHFFNMTGREHIELYASIKGVPPSKIPVVVASKLREVGLSDEDSNKLSAKYSGGMKRRLSLACATVGQPQLMFLDECSTGVDPVARREIWQMISNMVSNQDLAAEDRPSVILTTHSMEECEALCPRIGIMAAGRLKCIGSAQHLKSKFGQGFQVEMKIQNVDVKDKDFSSNLSAIADSVGIDAPAPAVADADVDQEQALPDSAPLQEGAFLKLEQVLVALQSLTGDDFLSSKLNANEPAGYTIRKAATSEEGVSSTNLAYFATTEIRMKKLHSFVQEHYPQNVLRERQDTKSRYEVSSEGVKIANIFGDIEEHKDELQVAEYSVSQTSLEQVFNMHAAEAARRLQS